VPRGACSARDDSRGEVADVQQRREGSANSAAASARWGQRATRRAAVPWRRGRFARSLRWPGDAGRRPRSPAGVGPLTRTLPWRSTAQSPRVRRPGCVECRPVTRTCRPAAMDQLAWEVARIVRQPAVLEADARPSRIDSRDARAASAAGSPENRRRTRCAPLRRDSGGLRHAASSTSGNRGWAASDSRSGPRARRRLRQRPGRSHGQGAPRRGRPPLHLQAAPPACSRADRSSLNCTAARTGGEAHGRVWGF